MRVSLHCFLMYSSKETPHGNIRNERNKTETYGTALQSFACVCGTQSLSCPFSEERENHRSQKLCPSTAYTSSFDVFDINSFEYDQYPLSRRVTLLACSHKPRILCLLSYRPVNRNSDLNLVTPSQLVGTDLALAVVL